MYVLVACEESQIVCKAFRKLGHIAFSCDIQRCSGGLPGYHIVGDVLNFLYCSPGCDFIEFYTQDGCYHKIPFWDMVIAHPPCTMLCRTSSVVLSKGLHTLEDVKNAVNFFMVFYNLRYIYPNIKLCIENPVPMRRCGLPGFTQTVQPYEYGDNFTKLTCLWLYNLPPLIPQCYGCTSGNSRNSAASYVGTVSSSKKRSKTFKGIANAMAIQWGGLL